jgi:hypothetical protein
MVSLRIGLKVVVAVKISAITYRNTYLLNISSKMVSA